MLRRSIGVACALFVGIASPAFGQHWDTPTFFSPRPHDDLGVYALKPEIGDWGVVGIWRQSGTINLGVRGGIGSNGDDRTVLIGAELFGPLNLEGVSPLALAWVTGIGASFDGVTSLRIPLGVTVGVPLGPEGGAVLTPYVHPRAALDISTFERVDGDEETDTDFDVDVDLGADLDIAGRWVIRAGYKIGDNDTFGLGFAFRMGRSVEVR
jgi:hypothetical protein